MGKNRLCVGKNPEKWWQWWSRFQAKQVYTRCPDHIRYSYCVRTPRQYAELAMLNFGLGLLCYEVFVLGMIISPNTGLDRWRSGNDETIPVMELRGPDWW